MAGSIETAAKARQCSARSRNLSDSLSIVAKRNRVVPVAVVSRAFRLLLTCARRIACLKGRSVSPKPRSGR